MSLLDPDSDAAEAYHGLRTNLFYSLGKDEAPKTIVLTSPGPREGKSFTCANLGVTLAQARKKTLLVDCDLRQPALHGFFELRNLEGVTSVLMEMRGFQEVLQQQEPFPGLKMLCAGPLPRNPSEVLGMPRLAELLSRAAA